MRRVLRAGTALLLGLAALAVPVSPASAGTPAGTPPQVIITAPSADDAWRVGQTISFVGDVRDAEDGTVPASRLSWRIYLENADGQRTVARFRGIRSGSFRTPDVAEPATLRLALTATDSDGRRATGFRALDPQIALFTLQSDPDGLVLGLNGERSTASFFRAVTAGSTNRVVAPPTQRVDGRTYRFASWSDGGARSHRITAETSAVLTARYAAR